MRFLFDTNIITEVAKPRPNARVLNWLLAHEVAGGIPSLAKPWFRLTRTRPKSGANTFRVPP